MSVKGSIFPPVMRTGMSKAIIMWTRMAWDQGCQSPMSSNIEIDDVIMHSVWRHFFFLKKREKDVVRIVTFDLIGLLPTNHIIPYITMAYGSLWGNSQCQQKNCSKNAKYLKFHCQKVEYTRNGKLAIIREISDSNLETGRNGSKSGVSWIIWENWQPCEIKV